MLRLLRFTEKRYIFEVNQSLKQYGNGTNIQTRNAGTNPL